MGPRFSPDMRWVSYTSNESGTFEIYVQPFDPNSPTGSPPGGGKWLVSKGGGVSARWNGNGKELFYAAPDGTIMSVDVSANPAFHPGIPKPLFKTKARRVAVRSNDLGRQSRRQEVSAAHPRGCGHRRHR